MCIICVKAKGVSIPSDVLLGIMWDNNPDGAGVAVQREGTTKIKIMKGFMNKEMFIERHKTWNIKDNDVVVYHFRIATSGGVNPERTHPFPVTGDKQALMECSLSCERAFIHNGIISNGNKVLSDTQLYVKDELAPFNDVSITDLYQYLSEGTVGSRCVLMDAHEGMILTGEWRYKDGLLFSNANYEATHKYPYSWSTYARCYNDDESYAFNDEWPDTYRTGTSQTKDQKLGTPVKAAEPEWTALSYYKTGCGYGLDWKDRDCTHCAHEHACTLLESSTKEEVGLNHLEPHKEVYSC